MLESLLEYGDDWEEEGFILEPLVTNLAKWSLAGCVFTSFSETSLRTAISRGCHLWPHV